MEDNSNMADEGTVDLTSLFLLYLYSILDHELNSSHTTHTSLSNNGTVLAHNVVQDVNNINSWQTVEQLTWQEAGRQL